VLQPILLQLANTYQVEMRLRMLISFLICIAVLELSVTAIVLHCRRGALPVAVPPPVCTATPEIRVRARHAAPVGSVVSEGPASGSVRTICGLDAASADRSRSAILGSSEMVIIYEI